jgi:pSer/pThr/pTyr-binding forkhead associated (FHA) protein
MKDFLKKIKKAFGAEEEESQAPATTGSTTNEEKPLKASSLPPAPVKREEIIRFIIHSMRAYVNETNTGVKGFRLYLLCKNNEEEILANIAVYADNPDLFKNELQRKLSDNYITPDANWSFEYNIVHDQLPDCRHQQGALGLDIIKRGQVTGNFTTAVITTLTGQTELGEYLLDPAKKQKFTIGRGKHPNLSSGAMHTNDIAFTSKEEPGFDAVKGAPNLSVSRNHAVIVFNTQYKKYMVAADKGGTPDSGNKTKLFTEDGKITRLDIAGAMHQLNDGDQIELGGNAKLLFREKS